MTLLKTDHPGYMKNKMTGVLINMDEGALNTVQAQRRRNKTVMTRLEKLEQDILKIKEVLKIK